MSRILISGAAGFIGSHLVDAFLAQGHRIIGVDDLSGGSMKNLTQAMPNTHFLFYKVDLADYKEMREVMMANRPEVVYHTAASAREGASFFDPYKITRTNVYASSVLLELAIKYGMERLVFMSSMATYGKGRAPFDERQRNKPVDIYGLMKSATEDMIQMLAEVHKFEYLILKPHNVFGIRQMFDPYRNVIAIQMNRIMRGEPLFIYGKDHVRAFSYIEDCIPALVKAAEFGVANSETINLGGKEAVTIRQATEEITNWFPSCKSQIVELPARHGEVEVAHCTTKKSEELLGYKEEIGWKEGIGKMSQWAHECGPQPWSEDKLALPHESMPETWKALHR